MGRWFLAPIVAGLSLWTSYAAAEPYRFPWPPTVSMELTQDCNDSFYADHIGSGKHAWDFANGTRFPVSVAREGVVTHVKMSSHSGCETSACVDLANYIVVDHGDGTASVYLHLDGDSLHPAVRCGQPVRQGQPLANAGSTGWSTGPHLHFQVNAVHAETAACECGEDGQACAPNQAGWASFWSTSRFPSLPVAFDEWSASDCNDRRMVLPFSQNVDTPTDGRLVILGRPPAALRSNRPSSRTETRPLVVLGVGGRKVPGSRLTDKAPPPSRETRAPSPRAPSAARPPR